MSSNNWFFNDLFKKFKFEDAPDVSSNAIATDAKDGAIEVSDPISQYAINLNWTYESQAELISTYREIANYSVVDYAIEDIVNEAVSFADDETAIEIDLSDVEKEDMSDKIKDRVYESFQKIYQILDLDNTVHQRLKMFYIDGRASYQKVVNTKNVSSGLLNIIELDTRYVTKVRNVEYDRVTKRITGVQEHFVYDESPISTKIKKETDKRNKNPEQFVLDPKTITYVTSGMTDPKTGYAISWLHKAVRPANQQRMMENALLIYRIVRAPERRIFYVDTSNLTPTKATQHLNNLKNSYRNKMSFNPETGAFKDERHLMTMQEDYWLPRNSAGRGTEVSTLASGQNLDDIADILYFQKELYKALNVPVSRLESESTFSLGRQSEISRDELKFAKLISKIKKRFNMLLLDLLKTELILTKVITAKEWEAVYQKIRFIYAQDIYIEEMKKAELYRERINLAKEYEEYVGKYVSNEFIRKEILKQTETEIEDQDKQIEKEKNDPKYKAAEDNDENRFQ